MRPTISQVVDVVLGSLAGFIVITIAAALAAWGYIVFTKLTGIG